jgi:glycosyltransferase involved in cell wall biosynthesis
MARQAKIINIMPKFPHYELFWNEPRPTINWDTAKGEWVGIWGLDWLDLIGNETLKLTDEFEYEVWQPDLRADRIYTCRYSNGLVHKLFPARLKRKAYGFKKREYVFSTSLADNLLLESKRKPVILRIDVVNPGIGREVLKRALNCPVIAQFWGEFGTPLSGLFAYERNMLKKINNISEHFALKRASNYVDVVTCSDERSRKNLRRYFGKNRISLSIGIDFRFWKRQSNVSRIKQKLGIEGREHVLLSSSRLSSHKQIDKVMGVLKKLDNDFDFLYVVTGHGSPEYERYLKSLSEELIAKGKVKFVGHVIDEQLRDFYNITDLFIMSSISEAGPTASIKALAMEVPVLSTSTGQMAEVLAEHGAGAIVPTNDYAAWECEFRNILSGRRVKILDREIVKRIHHWPYVAQQYVDLYRKLFDEYYG